jgi:hypothetical protein
LQSFTKFGNLGLRKKSVYVIRKIWNEKFWKKNHFWNSNWNFLFLILKKMARGNGNNWKMILKFEKLKYVMKIWNEKTEIFRFLDLKMFTFEIWNEKFRLKLKNWPYHQMEMKKQLKWTNHIFRLCHRDKTSNNTPIPLIPPMHTSIYHMCKLWWYTINLSRRILSYWSFFTSGMGWYVPP